MAVVDNAAGITIDASGQHNNSKVLDGLSDPTTAQGAETRAYGDVRVIVVQAATIVALPAYTAAGSGSGETLTATAVGVLTAQDSVTLVTGDKLLVRHATNPINNDVFVVTQGTVGTPYVLTRYSGLDTAGKMAGSLVRVAGGRRCGGGMYAYTGRATVSFGTTKLYRKRVDHDAPLNERICWRADFGSNIVIANNGIVPGTELVHTLATGTAAVQAANSATTIGEVSYTLGASASSQAGVKDAWTAANTQPDGGGSFIASNDVGYRIAGRIKVPVLSTSAQEYAIIFGLCKTNNTQQKTSSDGEMWIYDRTTNVNWRAVTAVGSTTTGTDTDSAVAVDNNYLELGIEKDSGDDTIYYFLNNTLVASHAANQPNAQLLGLLCESIKNFGTGSTNALTIDYIEKDVWWPKGRI